VAAARPGGIVLQIFALSRSAVTIRHWFEIDLDDASMEHGVRIELRKLRDQQHRGSESASQLVTVDDTLWRADIFDRLADVPGSFAAAHFHPEFAGNEPCARAWDPRLTSDPWSWLADQFANLGATPGRDAWQVDPDEASELRGLASTVVSTAKQFSPTKCRSASECFQLTRDVRGTVKLMISSLRAPRLLDAGWAAPWMQP
jgi:hypothetical protein